MSYQRWEQTLNGVSTQLVRDLERLGHQGRLVIPSDQDPALVSLLQEVAKMRRFNDGVGTSSVGDS